MKLAPTNEFVGGTRISTFLAGGTTKQSLWVLTPLLGQDGAWPSRAREDARGAASWPWR